MKNNAKFPISFSWSTNGLEEFRIIPRVGHLDIGVTKSLTIIFKSDKSNVFK